MKSGIEEEEYVIEYEGGRKETRTRIRRVEKEEYVIE
jgi:hypothetical protein